MIIDKSNNTVKYFDNGYKTVKLTDEQMKKIISDFEHITVFTSPLDK